MKSNEQTDKEDWDDWSTSHNTIWCWAHPEVAVKKKNELIKEITFETFAEGKCIQIMHVGPYSTEPETIDLLMKFMADTNHVVNGLHHEIYLSDPRKTEPGKMKTILRYPVK